MLDGARATCVISMIMESQVPVGISMAPRCWSHRLGEEQIVAGHNYRTASGGGEGALKKKNGPSRASEALYRPSTTLSATPYLPRPQAPLRPLEGLCGEVGNIGPP